MLVPTSIELASFGVNEYGVVIESWPVGGALEVTAAGVTGDALLLNGQCSARPGRSPRTTMVPSVRLNVLLE